MLADAAVTSDQPISSQRSSFGELHVDKRGVKVEEAALKIFRFTEAALTFAGIAEIGSEFARNVYAHIKAGESPEDAFRSGAISITSPGQSPWICALMAEHSTGKPRLLSFNEGGDGQILTDQKVVHLGSLHSGYFRLIEV